MKNRTQISRLAAVVALTLTDSRTLTAYGTLLVCLGMLTVSGCSGSLSGGFDPEDLANAALAQADSDNDGKLLHAELLKNPGLLAALKTSDRDQDGVITSDELKARMTSMQAVAKHACYPKIIVFQGRRPLSGATVRFVPEPFMGGFSLPATGVTDAQGECNLTFEGAGTSGDSVGGLKCGFYRVEITHPSKTLPTKVNTETILGAEVALDLGRASEELFFQVPPK